MNDDAMHKIKKRNFSRVQENRKSNNRQFNCRQKIKASEIKVIILYVSVDVSRCSCVFVLSFASKKILKGKR